MPLEFLEQSPWVVQKYGGTSVGKLLQTITSEIIPRRLETNRVAVVCSARSGTTKSNGSTSLLLKALHIIASPAFTLEDLKDIVNAIRISHIEAVQQIPCDHQEQVRTVEYDINTICDDLQSLLHAARGVDADVVPLNDIVESAFGGTPESQQDRYDVLGAFFFESLATEIAKRIQACKAKVPVVTVGLKAQECQIWKEVDGIFTADPNHVLSAKLLPTVTPEEAAELTYYGSEVIHPLAIDRLSKAQIPLRIKNVLNTSSSGTTIMPSSTRDPSLFVDPAGTEPHGLSQLAGDLCIRTNGNHQEDSDLGRWPTAITMKKPVFVANVVSNQKNKGHKFLAKLFDRLDHHRLSIDLMTISIQSVSLALSTDSDESSLLLVLADLEKFGTVTVTRDMAIISVIGHKMRNMVGVSGQIFGTLARNRINVYLIGQGASEINISFVVKSTESLLALRTIHKDVLGMPVEAEKQDAFKRAVVGPWMF
ncbi:MAG: hypothetical protein M1828_005812 [Chrysothrix sp. TS-e1954]|nr:MAG: hypothetical protein M1828_005812 [Chrysothrix sp. TS-e1954]